MTAANDSVRAAEIRARAERDLYVILCLNV